MNIETFMNGLLKHSMSLPQQLMSIGSLKHPCDEWYGEIKGQGLLILQMQSTSLIYTLRITHGMEMFNQRS